MRSGLLFAVTVICVAMFVGGCQQEGSQSGVKKEAPDSVSEQGTSRDKKLSAQRRERSNETRRRTPAPKSVEQASTGSVSATGDEQARIVEAAQSSGTVTQIRRVSPTQTPPPVVRLRAVEPAVVKKGDVTTIVITGEYLQDAKVTFRSGTQEIPVQPDAITAGEEISIMDRNFAEFVPGVYDVIVDTPLGRAELPKAFTVQE
jgi:hypothetical protein